MCLEKLIVSSSGFVQVQGNLTWEKWIGILGISRRKWHQLLGRSHQESLKNSRDGTEMGRLGDASPHYAPGCAWRGCSVSTIPGEKPYVAETVVKPSVCRTVQSTSTSHLCNQINNPSDICHSMSWTHQHIDIHISPMHSESTHYGEETRFPIDIIYIQLPPPTSIM